MNTIKTLGKIIVYSGTICLIAYVGSYMLAWIINHLGSWTFLPLISIVLATVIVLLEKRKLG